jgi:transposase
MPRIGRFSLGSWRKIQFRRFTAGMASLAILIMRLHEKIGLSVSDDTIYRALKDSGFSHVSVRPKAYKQDPRPSRRSKNLPYAWRKSAPASPRAPH